MIAVICVLPQLLMGQEKSQDCSAKTDTVTAARVAHEISLDARHPATEWQTAKGISFCEDWQGKNADTGRQTQVRLLWTPKTLYLRFECRYRELSLFEDSDASGRRDQLWDRDVAETFLQPDLDIFPEGLRNLESGMERSVWLDREHHTWDAELAIPMRALTANFDPAAVWRVNFFRVEGPREPRFYSAWRATNTPQPNFHVPAAFGKLRFGR